MTKANQEDLLSFQINIKKRHLAFPKHDALIIIHSDPCFHSIG